MHGASFGYATLAMNIGYALPIADLASKNCVYGSLSQRPKSL